MFFATLVGFGAVAQFTVSNIVVQSESAPQMRGRVISILLMAIFGMMPLGSLLVGAVSQHIGAPATVLGQGIIGIIVALAFVNFLTKRSKNAVPENLVMDETEVIIAEHKN
jgi:MFS family permease